MLPPGLSTLRGSAYQSSGGRGVTSHARPETCLLRGLGRGSHRDLNTTAEVTPLPEETRSPWPISAVRGHSAGTRPHLGPGVFLWQRTIVSAADDGVIRCALLCIHCTRSRPSARDPSAACSRRMTPTQTKWAERVQASREREDRGRVRVPGLDTSPLGESAEVGVCRCSRAPGSA
jgi:hypothetical protein